MASFEKTLDKIQHDPSTPKLQRVWKKVRATVAEKSLTAMWHKLNYHCSVLQLQLNLLQSHLQYHSNATLDCKAQIHEIRDTLSTGALQVSSFNDNVQDIKVSVEEVVRSTVATVNHNIGQTSGATTAQLQNISTLLEALQDQVSGNSARLTGPQRSGAMPQEGNSPPAPSDTPIGMNADLRKCLARLCELESRNPDMMLYEEEAETIIEDLEYFLSALFELKQSEDLDSGTGEELKEENQRTATITRRDMRRMRGLVSAAATVGVNQAPKRSTATQRGKVIQTHRTIDLVLPGCKTSITVNKRAFQKCSEPSRQGKLTAGPHAEEFFAIVKASIEDAESPAVLVAYLHQIQSDNGFYSLNPVVSIGRIVPTGSAIFEIVSRGDVEGLRRLLALGEGSLRDRDPRGTPLLHYAAAGAKTTTHGDMCKFLIQHGADVDEMAEDPRQTTGHSRTPMWLTRKVGLSWESITEFVRLFLEAGADPNPIVYDYVNVPDFRYELTFDDDALRLVLNNPIPFIDVESRDSAGRTMLLSFASKCSDFNDPVSLFNLLLAKGADIIARDGQGRNCLRLALESLWEVENADDIRQCLILLIQRGADIHSVDEDGVSTSDYAYQNPTGKEMGSCQADLWDAALSACGYNVRQIRLGYHRVPQYIDEYVDGCFETSFCNFEYQPKAFREFWKGREDACPYYHDPPVWCPRSTLLSGSCPFGGLDWLCPGPEAKSNRCPSSVFAPGQRVNESESDDLYGGDGVIRQDSEDSNCSGKAKLFNIDGSEPSDQSLGRENMNAESSEGHDSTLSSVARIWEIEEEDVDDDPAAESASESSEYHDTCDYA
ncbi:hypothetical protein AYO21_02527 [Fonsecaea monophora]|uniref:Uncharacterized protein n=1 Tax=Fonsecaea monophora TaxID=254056 RepID=A0A177FHM7_9EURO|nr:hypothetical protein AYO21_02527 [Fonsecaea monophora]OAG43241.1 hypothetical protein AYO21_02527 [Fonsecaea monophora]